SLRTEGAPGERIAPRPVNFCIHPADRPINTSIKVLRRPVESAQYCSDLYQQLHTKHGIRCSMTDGYDCYQNAMAERVNGILKTEFLLHRPKNLADAVKMVDESVLIYNEERPHLALKYKTPDAVHRAF
ncbi:integrase core domain-containing protein, partial [Pseudomonas lundensis]|uniref:integrase core domain-containing protein n=1 Tax=Pseudomonas lundensis TaxID=86185 RepID=UPI0021CC61B3